MKARNILFMLRKLSRDLRANRHLDINLDISPGQLRHYYLRFEEKRTRLNSLIHSLDPEGIPLNNSYIDVTPPRLHYYPITIGQYGLALFHSWLATGSPGKRDHFLRVATWFLRHAHEDLATGAFYWLTDIPRPEYGIHAPWKSAFAQARAISILVRAWQLTDDDCYLHTATAALLPFTADITRGGVAVDRDAGETFYEEYVAAVPTRVLDGHAFALFGLLDYLRAVPADLHPVGHALARSLFDEGIEGLARQLPRFDLGYWLRFNRCDLPGYPQDDPCTIGYLRIVRLQLLVLHAATRRDEFLQFARRCQRYDSLSSIPHVYRAKFRALKQLHRL